MNTRMNPTSRALALGVAVSALGIVLAGTAAQAADHKDAPGSTADHAADIADVYAWHDQAQNRLVAAVTFAGLAAAAEGPTYDANVLYTLHIDHSNPPDNVPDIDIDCRFGQNGAGEWGIKVENLPGAAGPIVGPTDKVLDGGGNTKVYAGPREDPFFFDLDGFRATIQTGTLSFDSANDTFAGLNVTAIVLEMNLTTALSGAPSLQLWATTGRKP
jgi:Domain of unknown function (DUF4331)